MEQINRIASDQQKLGDDIYKSLTNAKKEPYIRRTKENSEKRRQAARSLWEPFKKNHQKALQTGMMDHNYFKENYYGNVESSFRELERLLIEYEEQDPSQMKQFQDQMVQERRIKLQATIFQEISAKIEDIRRSPELDASMYERRREQLEEEWRRCKDRHEEIFMKAEDYENEYFKNNAFIIMEKRVQDAVDHIVKQLEKARQQQNQTACHLPEVKIPIFSGNYEDWSTFHDIFSNMVDNKQHLKNVEKMQYLKSNLKGEALKLIRNLQINDANYTAAWETLKSRYDNKRILVKKLLDKILNFPKINVESAQKLKELHDTMEDCTKAISNMGISTADWQPLLDHIIISRWDDETNKLFEQTLKTPHDLPDHAELKKFLITRFQSLELMGKKQYSPQYPPQYSPAYSKQEVLPPIACKLCKEQHYFIQCSKFKNMGPEERLKSAKRLRLCLQCLRHDAAKRCMSKEKCRTCGKAGHHTMLHVQPQFNNNNSSVHSATNGKMSNSQYEVLLATAVVQAKTVNGSWINLRLMLDNGSQVSLITEEAAQMLALPREKICATISGIGPEGRIAKSKLSVQLQPRFPSPFKINQDLLVLTKVTSNLPQIRMQDVDKEEWRNYYLADPKFNIPGPIDILLGADGLGEVVLGEIFKIKDGPVAQNTEFGWVLSGLAKKLEDNRVISVVSMVSRRDEDEQLTKFWSIEEVGEEPNTTEEENQCEAFYENTTVRHTDGSYTVRIPFKEDPSDLGDSRKQAVARFLQLEKKLAKNNKLRVEYGKFMQEYQEMGHMKLASTLGEGKYYIPHQAVIREESSTTKLRVVFDASCKTNSGKSLNEKMFNGPRLQKEIFSILVKWRMHMVVFKADIEKMYRQIKMHPEDQNFQRILWRYDQNQPIQEYILRTVTYGTTAAPYLAVKTLQRLAEDEKQNFPRAADAMEDFYVDDVLSGAESIEEALKMQQELISMLKAGGFKLRKWSSNKKELLSSLPKELLDNQEMDFNKDETKKSLGVLWNPCEDVFLFKVNIGNEIVPSKRKILSEIAKLYDPLGWLAPVTIIAKMLIQELWIKELEWDKEVPEDIKVRWIWFLTKLKDVEKIRIPRWTNFQPDIKQFELHGFCDASEKAYGAVIYSRSVEADGKIKTCLMVSKSKVAPIKMKKTLPRLELCAAVLLTKLMKQVTQDINMPNVKKNAWTDSTITLAWIKGDPCRWKNFVGNRVSIINESMSAEDWRHVGTKDNPADMVSRGVDPSKLHEMALWWTGPKWLSQEQEKWPSHEVSQVTSEEAKKHVHMACNYKSKEEIIEQFSTLTRMLRVLSYCRRFIQRCRKQRKDYTEPLTVKEIEETLVLILKKSQLSQLGDELRTLQQSKEISNKSKISSLRPFLDKNGVMRVGGRIKRSSVPEDQKHPIILTKDCWIATLIIRHAHRSTLHGGNQATLAYCRRKYWITNGKNLVRKVIRNCPTCIRYRGQTISQLMGDLPEARVNPSPPFTNTGVDYAGPVQIRASKGRGTKSYKGYIAIFVCFATKAVHIEVVSDLTSDAFLAAFRRFVARRGPCANMYSDNGTTFVGASKFIQEAVSNFGTQWHFIPPTAPHFGGLWESAVKSMKHHIKRVIGDATLTYEELSTLTQQTEACLNSRPLCPLSNDPEEVEALTPGHFLIGRAIVSPSTPFPCEGVMKNQTRWNLVQKINMDLWKTWSSEYLHILQQRNKWKTMRTNVKVGDLVLIKEDNLAPGRWPLARIDEVHQGDDGAIRVVTLNQSDKRKIKRPVTKLIALEDTTEEIETKRTRPATASTSCKSLVLISMVLCLFVPNMVHGSYTITKTRPGLYIEHMGSAKINRGIFRIEADIPKKQIYQYETNIHNLIKHMEKLILDAKKLDSEIHGEELIHHLREEETQFQWLMKAINGTSQHRNKRGLLGKILTSVFGVNEEVYQDINALDENQKRLIKTSTHQSKLLFSTLGNMTEVEARTNRTLQHFVLKLNQAIDSVNAMNQWYGGADKSHLNLHILNTYQLAVNYVQEVHEQTKNLMELMFNSGHFYNFITPAQVKEKIRELSQKLPSNLQVLELPIVRTTVQQTQTNICIFGHFLITEGTEFDLMKVTPVPLKMTDKAYWIPQITNNLIAVDYNSQRYFEIPTEDLTNCIKLERNTFVASPAVVRSIESSPNCIIDQIYNRTNEITCPTQKVGIHSMIWKQLYQPNTWMFITPKPTKIAIKCNGIREEVTINQTGIIQLSQDCSIHTSQSVLNPTFTITIPVLHAGLKQMNVTIPEGHDDPGHPLVIAKEPVIGMTDQLGNGKQDQEELELDDETWNRIRVHTAAMSTTTTMVWCSLLGILLAVGKWTWSKYHGARRNNHEVEPPEEESEYMMRPQPPPIGCPRQHVQNIEQRIFQDYN